MEIPSFDLTSSHWNVIETYKFTDNIETTALRDIDPQFMILQFLKPGSSDTGGLTGTLSHVRVKTGVQNSRRQKRQSSYPEGVRTVRDWARDKAIERGLDAVWDFETTAPNGAKIRPGAMAIGVGGAVGWNQFILATFGDV